MKRYHLSLIAIFVLLSLFGYGCSSTTGSSTTITSAKDVAEIVAISAGGLAQAGSNATPGFALGAALQASVIQYGIPGFTFDSSSGAWTGTTQFGATPSLKFYIKSTGDLITVDVTNPNNYTSPENQLFGVTPPGQTSTGVQMEVTVSVNETFTAGYTILTTVVTGKLDADADNTSVNASRFYSGTSGTVTGDFGTINISAITLVAADLGATVTGSYTFTALIDGTTYTGTAQFDQGGCNGATIKDADGNILGTALINTEGQLVFTDAATDVESIIDRIES